MKAARQVLNEKGLEGTTVPRVASRAGLSAGSVYRRFPDKDALLRSVVLDFLQSLDARNDAVLTPKLAKLGTLRTFIEMAVKTSIATHRQKAGMLRAIHQFVLSHPSSAFKKKVHALDARSVQRVADFLLLKKKEIKHPRPEEAVPFALMTLGFILQDVIALDVLPDVKDPNLPKNDDDLARELIRVLSTYLGIE